MAPLHEDHDISKGILYAVNPSAAEHALPPDGKTPEFELALETTPVLEIINYIKSRAEEVIGLIGKAPYDELMRTADIYERSTAENSEYPSKAIAEIRELTYYQIKRVLELILTTETSKKETRRTASITTRNKHLQEVNALLAKKVQTDPLTDLYNRGGLATEGQKLFELCKQKNEPFSCLFFDIDYFKHVNDQYGHDAGDTVLKTFAKLLARELRGYDVIARPGGEEFIVLCPFTDLEEAAAAAERARKRIETTPIPITITNGGGTPVQVLLDLTCTVGVAQAGFSKDTGPDDVQKLADEAMLRGKTQHRNIVATIQPQGDEPPIFKYPYLNDLTRRPVAKKDRQIH